MWFRGKADVCLVTLGFPAGHTKQVLACTAHVIDWLIRQIQGSDPPWFQSSDDDTTSVVFSVMHTQIGRFQSSMSTSMHIVLAFDTVRDRSTGPFLRIEYSVQRPDN